MRPASSTDVRLAFQALVAMKAKGGGAQMRFTDEDTAEQYLMSRAGDGFAHVHNGYFILWDVGRPWYSKEDFLLEELIIRIEKTDHPVESAIEALSDLAAANGIQTAIVAGDTQIGYMAPKYLRSGFKTLGTQFIKEIPYGLVAQSDRGSGPD